MKWRGSSSRAHPNKRLQPTIASVTPCAGAQAAPATLAAEANVRHTKIMLIDLNLVNRFVNLQGELLLELGRATPEGPSVRPSGKGALTYDRQIWQWYRHGAGIMFCGADGIVVDVHDCFFSPDSFDPWRLLQFVESMCKERVGFDHVLTAIIELVDLGVAVEFTEPGLSAGARRFRLCERNA